MKIESSKSKGVTEVSIRNLTGRVTQICLLHLLYFVQPARKLRYSAYAVLFAHGHQFPLPLCSVSIIPCEI